MLLRPEMSHLKWCSALFLMVFLFAPSSIQAQTKKSANKKPTAAKKTEKTAKDAKKESASTKKEKLSAKDKAKQAESKKKETADKGIHAPSLEQVRSSFLLTISRILGLIELRTLRSSSYLLQFFT